VTGDTPGGAWHALTALVTRAGYRLKADAEAMRRAGTPGYADRIVNVDPRYELAEPFRRFYICQAGESGAVVTVIVAVRARWSSRAM
jgi:hypothetical protein